MREGLGCLLAGGTKARQQRDIEMARHLWREYRRRRRQEGSDHAIDSRLQGDGPGADRARRRLSRGTSRGKAGVPSRRRRGDRQIGATRLGQRYHRVPGTRRIDRQVAEEPDADARSERQSPSPQSLRDQIRCGAIRTTASAANGMPRFCAGSMPVGRRRRTPRTDTPQRAFTVGRWRPFPVRRDSYPAPGPRGGRPARHPERRTVRVRPARDAA